MKYREEHITRISSGKSLYLDLIKRKEKIALDLETLVRDVESYEHTICKDSIGKDLNIGYVLRLKDTKSALSDVLGILRKLSLLKTKHSLAFDSLRMMVEEDTKG